MADSGMESEEESWSEAWDDMGQSSTLPSVGKNINASNGDGFTKAKEDRNNKTSNKAITAVATTSNQQPCGIDRTSGSGTGGKASAKGSGAGETEVKQSGTTSGGMMSRMALNDNKAGMEGLDRDKINAIIYEASKGSKYFENEKKKEAQMEKRIAEQLKVVQSLSAEDIRHGVKEADNLLKELEAERDLSRSIVHMDMDMFYAAVEMRDQPELKDKPMAVGGNSMLSTSNYAARRFGVRAAMPGFIAKKLCPQVIIVPLHFHKYTAVSNQVRGVLAEYDPNFAPMSLDEAYLDYTEHLQNRKDSSVASRTFPQVADWENDCCCSLAVREASITGGADTSVQQCNTTKSLHSESGNNDGNDDEDDNDNDDVDDNDGDNNDNDNDDENDDVDKNVYSNENPLLQQTSLKQGSDNCSVSNDDILDSKKNTSLQQQMLDMDQLDIKSLSTNTTDTVNQHQDSKGNVESHEILDSSSLGSDAKKCVVCKLKLGVVKHWEEFGCDIEEAVREMRWRIEQQTSLTASAGIAPNTMIAKVCSDKNKPNGQYRVLPTRSAVKEFVDALPIRKVSGIGKVSAQMLSAVGVESCHDLYTQRGVLYHLYSSTSFHHFMRVALGLGSTRVTRDGERKSISVERTFREINDPEELLKKCQELSESLAEDMHADEIVGKTVSIKIKTVNFATFTRSHTISEYSDHVDVIFSAARDLLKIEIQNCSPNKLRLRLMGVRMSNLLGKDQLSKQKQKSILSMFQKMGEKKASQPTTPEMRKETGNTENTENIDDTEAKQTSKPDNENEGHSSSSSLHYKNLTPCNSEKTPRTGMERTTPDTSTSTSHTEQSFEEFSCPVCEETIVCSGIESFNEHLDNCIFVSPKCSTQLKSSRIKEEQDSDNSSDVPSHNQTGISMKSDEKQSLIKDSRPPKEIGSIQPSKSKELQPSIKDSRLPKERVGIHPSKSLTTLQENFALTMKAEEKQVLPSKQSRNVEPSASTSTSNTSCLSCPICRKEYGDLQALNHHLDECLSKGAIKRCQQETRHEDSGRVRKKPRTSANTIDNFFKKKPN